MEAQKNNDYNRDYTSNTNHHRKNPQYNRKGSKSQVQQKTQAKMSHPGRETSPPNNIIPHSLGKYEKNI